MLNPQRDCTIELHGGPGLDHRDWTVVLVAPRKDAVRAFQAISWKMTGHYVDGARLIDPDAKTICTKYHGLMLQKNRL